MKFFLNLALKNMFRQKGRTMLTLIPVIAGTVLLVYTMSLVDGLNDMSYNNIINYQTAHAKIFSIDYDMDRKGDNDNAVFEPDGELLDYLNTHRDVVSYTEEIMFAGNLSDGINKIPVSCLGIKPNTYRNTFKTLEHIPAPSSEPANGNILIGAQLAKLFDIEKEGIFFLEGRTRYGAYDALDLKYAGSISSGNPNIDRNSVLVNIESAKRFLETDGSITNIAILLKSRNMTDGFVAQMGKYLKEHYPQLKILSWKEEEKDFFAFAYMDQVSGYIMIIMVLIIAGVGIANTMLLSTYERLKEIGTMRALGSTSGIIMKLYITEGAMIGILGALIGSMLGILLMWHAHRYGLDMSMFIQEMDIGYPIDSVLRGSFNMMIILKTVLFTMIMAVMSSLYPARRAIKEQIVHIMR